MLAKVFTIIGLTLAGLTSAIPAAAPEPEAQRLDPVISGPIRTLTLIPLPTTTTCAAVTVTRIQLVTVTKTVTSCPGTCPINCTQTVGYVQHVVCSVPPQGCTNTVTPTITLPYPANQLCPTITTVTSHRSCNPTPGCPEPVPVTVPCPYS